MLIFLARHINLPSLRCLKEKNLAKAYRYYLESIKNDETQNSDIIHVESLSAIQRMFIDDLCSFEEAKAAFDAAIRVSLTRKVGLGIMSKLFTQFLGVTDAAL